eukprot:g1526.t1
MADALPSIDPYMRFKSDGEMDETEISDDEGVDAADPEASDEPADDDEAVDAADPEASDEPADDDEGVDAADPEASDEPADDDEGVDAADPAASDEPAAAADDDDDDDDDIFDNASTGATGTDDDQSDESDDDDDDDATLFRAAKDEGESDSAVAYTADGEEHDMASADAVKAGEKARESEIERLEGEDSEGGVNEILSQGGSAVKGKIHVSDVSCAEWVENEFNAISLKEVLEDVLFDNSVLLEDTGAEDLAHMLAAEKDQKENDLEIIDFEVSMELADFSPEKKDCICEKTQSIVSTMLDLKDVDAEYSLEGEPDSDNSADLVLVVQARVSGDEEGTIDSIRSFTEDAETLKAALVTQCPSASISNIKMELDDDAADGIESATGGATGLEEDASDDKDDGAQDNRIGASDDDNVYMSRFASVGVRMMESSGLEISFAVIFPADASPSAAKDALDALISAGNIGDSFRTALIQSNSGASIPDDHASIDMTISAQVAGADEVDADISDEGVNDDEPVDTTDFAQVNLDVDIGGVTVEDAEMLSTAVGAAAVSILQSKEIPSAYEVVEVYEMVRDASGDCTRKTSSDVPTTLAEGEPGAEAFLQLQEKNLRKRLGRLVARDSEEEDCPCRMSIVLRVQDPAEVESIIEDETEDEWFAVVEKYSSNVPSDATFSVSNVAPITDDEVSDAVDALSAKSVSDDSAGVRVGLGHSFVVLASGLIPGSEEPSSTCYKGTCDYGRLRHSLRGRPYEDSLEHLGYKPTALPGNEDDSARDEGLCKYVAILEHTVDGDLCVSDAKESSEVESRQFTDPPETDFAKLYSRELSKKGTVSALEAADFTWLQQNYIAEE